MGSGNRHRKQTQFEATQTLENVEHTQSWLRALLGGFNLKAKDLYLGISILSLLTTPRLFYPYKWF